MARRKGKTRSETKPMLFDSWNYKVLTLGLVLIVVGFTAMYFENEVQGFISLFVSPVLIMAGYLAVILAILKQDSTTGTSPDHTSQ